MVKYYIYICIYLYFTINMVAQIINNTLLNELILLTHMRTHIKYSRVISLHSKRQVNSQFAVYNSIKNIGTFFTTCW